LLHLVGINSSEHLKTISSVELLLLLSEAVQWALNVFQLLYCKISHIHHPLFPYLSLVFILIITLIPASSHRSAASAYQEPLYWEVLKPVLCQFCPILLHFSLFYLREGWFTFFFYRETWTVHTSKSTKGWLQQPFRHVCSYQNCLLALPYLSVCLSIHMATTQLPLDRFSWNFVMVTFIKICHGDWSLVHIRQKYGALYIKNLAHFILLTVPCSLTYKQELAVLFPSQH